ncbi:unnamed protein product [Lactuca virosa]|uniref:SHSP domain-containing protein n=1 Tax=Lactuca virosa TaxID=75947 RepID=A0AAU9P7L9_9ASTR|nr:unnamed protein product [Lactuca virosa]
MDTSSKLGLHPKDETDPVFITQQTDSMFILKSHLKGYDRSNIKIEINEDGSRITISGKNPVSQEEIIKGFQKTFTIPEGVVLDKVKARFDQDESRLIIRMPKSVHGIVGIGIQELENPIQENENHEMKNEETLGSNDLTQEEEVKPREKSSIICTPVIAGSTLFVSIIVVVLSLFRSKTGSREKKN